MDLTKIESDLNDLDDENEIENYINEIKPGWIVDIINGYSDDYKILRKNWYQICEVCKVSPRKIITVRHLPTDNTDKDFELIHVLADNLSSKGYLMRRFNELVKCEECGRGLLSEDLYKLFKDRGSKVLPKKWSNRCSACLM